MYPNGVGNATGNSLSLYLLSDQSNDKGYVEAKLRVIDQIQSNNFEKKGLISTLSTTTTNLKLINYN